MKYTRHLLGIIVIICCASVALGCRPESCSDASPVIEKVRVAIDAEKMDAASSGLAELVALLGDEGGYLGGFREKSASLRDQIERQHDLTDLSERDRDIAERRLVPLIQGWQREARAVERRCATSYLL